MKQASVRLLDRARRTDPNTRRFGLWILATVRRSFSFSITTLFIAFPVIPLYLQACIRCCNIALPARYPTTVCESVFCLLRDAAVCLRSPDAVAPPTRLMPFCPCDRRDSPSLLNRTQSRLPRASFGHGEVSALLASGCAEPGPA